MRTTRTGRLRTVRRRLREDGVVGVFVRPDGTMMNLTTSNIGRRLPQKGRLYSRLAGVKKLFSQAM